MNNKYQLLKQKPVIENWLKDIKSDFDLNKCGMFLLHNGVVRETSKEQVRSEIIDKKPVKNMIFNYDQVKVEQAIEKVSKLSGIYYIGVWLNEGKLSVGEDIMLVLVGGDIRPNAISALESLVSDLKQNCVMEIEDFG